LGSFIVANSWGTGWGNAGFIYVPYRLFASSTTLYVINEAEEKDVEMVAKIKLYHECRDIIDIGVYISDNPWAQPPTYWTSYNLLKSISQGKGGCMEILGDGSSNPIELAFDLTDYIAQYSSQTTPQLKIILGVREHGDYGDDYEGTIYEYSIIDYRGAEPFEVYHHDQTLPRAIGNNATENIVMDYFVLPGTISGTQTFQYNTIVRDEVTVPSSSEMTVNSQSWDFYDGGNLIVSDNATLNINGATNVLAMRDEGQIELQGNMNVASNVSFDRRYALSLPHFTLFINNSSKNYAFSDFDFKGSMIGESNTLELDNIKFEASDIEYVGDLTLDGLDPETQSLTVDFQGGDLLVQNNDLLLNTYISASMPDANQNTIDIHDNLSKYMTKIYKYL
jgi:hypothetical protein